MGYTLKTNIANRANYGSSRKTSQIKYIVVHYTANDGDTDEANAKYFKNNVTKTSAHYFVDDDSVTQSVHDNYVAWHCGGSRYSDYKTTGGAKFYGKCTNTNSIGIELCDTVKDGKYGFTDKTITNAIALIKDKMEQYNVPIDRVIRHFDVTGKICPQPLITDKSWNEFKAKITAKIPKAYTGKLPSLGLKGYIKQGDKGDNVKKLQQFLNWCINAKLNVDGSFGPATLKAVKEYQKKYGLTVDGFFGKKSLEKAKTIKK